jgi:hypothetical protein
VSKEENDSGYAARYFVFLFRSIVIGLAFYLPACFFHQTRKVLQFIANLEAVQIVTDIFQLIIILTLLGLILQGVFYVLYSGLRSLKSRFDSKVAKERAD